MMPEPKPKRPNAVAAIAVVCMTVVAVALIARMMPRCPEVKRPTPIETFVPPSPADFDTIIPQRIEPTPDPEMN
jgi:hypothetical protein